LRPRKRVLFAWTQYFYAHIVHFFKLFLFMSINTAEIAYFDSSLVQFVVKITKHCNLRCTYCYEYPYLADKTRMSLAEIEAMFRNIADYYKDRTDKQLQFIWHGGEPFIIEPDYYFAIHQLQADIFTPAGFEYYNTAQTNLTLLSANYIDALKNKSVFDNIGVSLDLYGTERVNLAGKQVEEKVLDNMQKLNDNGIPFGCITVLSRQTYPFVEKIYTFFDEINANCRFLPIYRTDFDSLDDTTCLRPEEVIDAFQRIFDTWLQSENAVDINPLQEFLRIALRVIFEKDTEKMYYDKAFSDSLYVVNTNGEVFYTDEVYETEPSYGNIFTTPFAELRNSPAYHAVTERSRVRIAAVCLQCPYYGACAGHYMDDITFAQMSFDATGAATCAIARPMISYIIDRLHETGLAAEMEQLVDLNDITGQGAY
jgi:uncharacterized protein